MKSTNIFQQSNKTQTKKKPRFKVQDSVLEQLKSVGGGVRKGIKNDLIKGVGNTAMKSLFNPSSLRRNENMPNREFPAFGRERGIKKIERPREVFVYTAKEAEMQRKIEDIRAELKAMIDELKKVDSEIEKSVESRIPQTGVYYENYLDRLKAILTVLRKELQSSSTWQQMANTRKKAKGYWNMYKKKGTKFGLSAELKMTHQTG